MRVASWNIEGRLTRFAGAGKRGSPEQILEVIERLDCDILVLPEASNANDIEPAIMHKLKELGYSVQTAFYNEVGDRTYKALTEPTIKLLSRLEVIDFHELRLGDIRTMLVADVVEPDAKSPVRIFGLHIDDRNETNRLNQIEDVLPCVNDSPYPVVMMGDFNAMHRHSLPARFLRKKIVRFAVDKFPHKRIKDILIRLSGMAVGDTLRRIEEGSDLQRTNLAMRPTTTPKMRGQEWMPSIRMAQIDHMYVSPQITATNFHIARDGGSDHRAISAELRLVS